MNEPRRWKWISNAAALLACTAWLGGCGGTNHDDNPEPTDLIISQGNTRLGGLLYDQWWVVNGFTEPPDTFPLYTKTNGTQSGSNTWRCQECHGWDYRGSSGAFATGPHFTGVAGVFERIGARTNQELFDVLTSGTPPPSGGSALTAGDHAFSSVMTDFQIVSLVRFLREGVIDTTPIVDPDGRARGNPGAGAALYAATSSDPNARVGECALCHGADGVALDLSEPDVASSVGAVARENPWRTLHKIRWGDPGTAMPSTVESDIPLDGQSDLLAHAQTLPGG